MDDRRDRPHSVVVPRPITTTIDWRGEQEFKGLVKLRRLEHPQHLKAEGGFDANNTCHFDGTVAGAKYALSLWRQGASAPCYATIVEGGSRAHMVEAELIEHDCGVFGRIDGLEGDWNAVAVYAVPRKEYDWCPATMALPASDGSWGLTMMAEVEYRVFARHKNVDQPIFTGRLPRNEHRNLGVIDLSNPGYVILRAHRLARQRFNVRPDVHQLINIEVGRFD